jgi:glycosyltransferase involved in cell wall biosynthesis
MNTGNLLLTACMIVRDEEKNIERCLKSLKGIVDEIVVVDTGSVDNTINIAKHYDACVYHHLWENDFSLHRNQALSYAKGKWVLIIDADEELFLPMGSNAERVRNFLHQMNPQYPAAAILLKDIQKGNAVMQFNSTRFFRNGEVKYEGIVHNQPKVNGEAMFCPFVSINHYGYDLTPEQKEKKFNRTHALLTKQVEQGQIEEGLPYYYLCQLHAEYKQPQEAVVFGEKYWKLYVDNKITKECFNGSHFFTMIKQYMKIGDKEKAHEWLIRGLELLPGDIDMAAVSLEYGVWIKDPDLQLNAAREYIELYKVFEKNPTAKTNKFTFSLRPEFLSMAFYYLTVLHLKSGAIALQDMVRVLSKLPAPFRDGVLHDLNEELKVSGLPIKFEAPKPADKKPVDDNIKIDGEDLTTMSL